MKALLSNRTVQMVLFAAALVAALHWSVMPPDVAMVIGFAGATLNTGQLTLLDISKRMSPDGKVAPIVELLSQRKDILEDIVWKTANQPTSHVMQVRTGLPAVYWRQYNAGVPSSKSTTAQTVEPLAMLEARSHIDMKLLKLNGNSAAFRLSEEAPFIEAMGQEMVNKMFNGNVGADMKTFSGLATRYSSTAAGNGGNIILAGGAGSDNASMYLVVWGEDTIYGLVPPGGQAGLQSRDLGEESVQDSNGNWYQAARSLFQWDAGLATADWRAVVRIANIDVSDWLGITGTQASTAATNLLNLMTKAIFRLPDGMLDRGRAVFYTNRSIQEGLMLQAMARSTNALGITQALNQFGQRVNQLQYQGIPIRTIDALSVAETLVS